MKFHLSNLVFKLSVGLLIVLSLFAWKGKAEEESSSSVVDLGQLSVTGEVRRPAISWIDSQKSVREMVPALIKIEYDAYEQTLLEPKKLERSESEEKNERSKE